MIEDIVRIFHAEYARARLSEEPLLSQAVLSWVEAGRPRSVAVQLDAVKTQGWYFGKHDAADSHGWEPRAAAACFFWESIKEQVCIEGEAGIEHGEPTKLRLVPRRVEFWSNRAFRLHERTVYALESGVWTKTKLYP